MPRISKDSTRSIGKVDDADSYTGTADQEAVSPRRNIIKVSNCFETEKDLRSRDNGAAVTKAHYIFKGPRNTDAFHGELLCRISRRAPLLPALLFAVESLQPKLVGTAPLRFVYQRNAAIWNTLRLPGRKNRSIRRNRNETARTYSSFEFSREYYAFSLSCLHIRLSYIFFLWKTNSKLNQLISCQTVTPSYEGLYGNLYVVTPDASWYQLTVKNE